MVWAILNPDISDATREITDNPSHRVVAVLGGAAVEEALRRALEMRMRSTSITERFFSWNGPMGGFNAKIQLGYLLGMYSKEALKTLLALADIRNVFAHKLTIHTFEANNPKLKEGLDRLILHTVYQWYPHPFYDGDSNIEVEAPTSARETFIVNLKILLVLLMRDLRLHLPHSNNFNPLPAAPGGRLDVPETEEETRQK